MATKYYQLFIRNNAIVMIGHILIYMKGLILLPIIIKSAGTTIYGGYVLTISIIGLVFGISSFGAGFRYKRFIPSASDSASKQQLFFPQFYFQLLIIALVSLLLLGFRRQFTTTLIDHSIDISLYLIAIYFFSYTLYSQFADYYRYTNRAIYFSLATISYPYITILLIVIFNVLYKLNIDYLLIANILALVVISTSLFLKAVFELRLKFIFFRLRELVQDIKLGFPLVLGYVIDFILSGSDRFVIASLISVTAVGYYNPAYTLGSLLILFPKVSGVVLPPLLSRAVDSNREHEAVVMFNYTFKLFLIFGIPFVFGSYLFSNQLLTLFANPEVAQKAKLVTPLIAIGTFAYGLSVIFNSIFFVRLKTKIMLKMNLIAAILNLTLNIIFIYIFRQIIVAAITTLIAYIIVGFLAYRAARDLWNIDLHLITALKALFASITMFITVKGTNSYLISFTDSYLLVLLAQLVLAILTYFSLMFLIKGISIRELGRLK